MTTQERIRRRAQRIRTLERDLEQNRAELHGLMRLGRTQGMQDTTIAAAAGITKARIGQMLGPRTTKG